MEWQLHHAEPRTSLNTAVINQELDLVDPHHHRRQVKSPSTTTGRWWCRWSERTRLALDLREAFIFELSLTVCFFIRRINLLHTWLMTSSSVFVPNVGDPTLLPCRRPDVKSSKCVIGCWSCHNTQHTGTRTTQPTNKTSSQAAKQPSSQAAKQRQAGTRTH